ncbi:MAG: hypothetical protein K6G58_03455 [Lachnospiraceae bacterium]|nr:hypothetical protein [Lachnospiraceae bacterium]
MIRKVMMLISSAVLAGVIFTASSVDAKAALSCTYDIINDASSDIANATANYNAAKADEAAKLAKFNAIKADPAHSLLDYEVAAAEYQNAVNVSQWWLTQLNNSKAFLTNIKGREAFEDKFAANRIALYDLTTLQASKFAADGAANMANGTLAQIAEVERAIAGYQVMLPTSPSLQKEIDALNVKLAILKAEYEKRAAVAAQKAAEFANNVNTLGYQAYSKGFEDYQFNREYQRDNLNWDPKGYY